MQQVQSAPRSEAAEAIDGTRIPPLTHREAMSMAAEEMKRFVSLIEALGDDDWPKPTACTLWSVKDIVAHQAAHITGTISRRHASAQMSPKLMKPYQQRGMDFLDAWNQSQVDLRGDASPDALIAEVREHSEASLRGRDRMIPALLRDIPLPLPGLDQPRSPGYIFDLIYTRDMWMHRIDICQATGRKMTFDSGHDARTVALIVRDLALKCRRGLGGRAAILELTGAAGGRYQIGHTTHADAMIEIDIQTFATLTSGRDKAAQVLAENRARLSGDTDFGKQVVQFMENRVLY